MKQENAERMFDILATREDSSEEDLKFFRNNVSEFSTWMLNTATGALTKMGMPEEIAKAMLVPLVEVSKMAGASEYHDFAQVADMFKEEGLS